MNLTMTNVLMGGQGLGMGGWGPETLKLDSIFAFKEVTYHSATLKPYWE